MVSKISGNVFCPGETVLPCRRLLDMTTAIDALLPRTSEPEAARAHRALFSDPYVVKESTVSALHTPQEVAQDPFFSNPE